MIIRIFLTFLLLLAVYKETGIWTTIAFALIAIAMEQKR